MIFCRIYLLLTVILFSSNLLATKDSCLKINEAQWQKTTKEKNYIETYKDWDTNKSSKDSDISPKSGLGSVTFGGFKYIFYFLLAAAIIFLLVKILQNINSSPSLEIDKGVSYTLAEVEDKILEVDLDKFLNEALAKRDFRLALRIKFLIIIKTLTLSGKIIWTKEKTNWEYHNEIKEMALALKFREIIMTFEPIWYGEYELTELQFNTLSPSYESFKSILVKNG
jgi:hypothetical protein